MSGKVKIKLADALLRRKELHTKVEQLKTLKAQNFFENVVKRVDINASLSEVTGHVAKCQAAQITHEFDTYASFERIVDAAIQQANWSTDVEVPADVMKSYMDLYPPKDGVGS